MNWKQIRTLIAMCGLIGGAVGITISTAGVFYSSVAADLAVGRGTVAMTTTICSIVGSVMALFIPKILKESNLKAIILLSTVLVVGGAFGMSISQAIWQLYLFSVLRGLGSGMTNFILVTFVLNNWFYAKRGLITSITMAFTGVPGMLLSNFFTNVILTKGWRTGYVVVAISVLVFMLPAVLFPLSIKPETQGDLPYGYQAYQEAKQEGKITTVEPSQYFNYFSFIYILILFYSMMSSSVPALQGHFPGFADSLGQSAALGATMLSISSACNIAGKLLFGTLADKAGTLKTMLLMTVITVVGLFLLFVNVPMALLVGSALFPFCFGVSSVGLSLVCTEMFGMENYGKAYPMVSLLGGIANAVAATLIGTAFDMTGSYTPVLWISLVFEALVALILITVYSMHGKKEAR